MATAFDSAIKVSNLLGINDKYADNFKYDANREHDSSIVLSIVINDLVKYVFTKKECEAAYYDRIVGDWVLCADTTDEVRIDLFKTTRIVDN